MPYFWSFKPSFDQIAAQGAAWICTLLDKPAVNSDDPTLKNVPRRLALGYDTGALGSSGQELEAYRARMEGLAESFASAADRACHRQVFDDFGVDPATGKLQRALWLNDLEIAPYTHSGEALACMEHIAQNAVCPNNHLGLDRDTSVVCFLCNNVDSLAGAEPEADYFPEFIFVSGDIADSWGMRLGTQFIYGTPQGFTRAFGLSEFWQLPGFTATYWYRAYSSTDPASVIDPFSGMETYQTLMQLFSAVQLGGRNLDPHTVAFGDVGSNSSYVGMYGWQRRFTYISAIGDSPAPTAPPASPAAGFGPGDQTFLKGMEEERWDPTGVPAGGPYANELVAGCFRLIDNMQRFSTQADASHNLLTWSSASYDETQGLPPSTTPLPPCDGDHWGANTTTT